MKYLLFFTAFFCLHFTNAQNNQHPIDFEMEKCLNNDTTNTYIMLDCVRTARDLWEEEINRYYNLLMSKIDEEQQKRLIDSQQKWVDFKNAEIKFSNSTYYGKEGSMWRVVGLSNQKDIYKSRALELKNYYETLTFE